MNEGASNSGRTFIQCEHIYKNLNADTCPNCGRDTHETDWAKQGELHREWIASGKATYGGWWSI